MIGCVIAGGLAVLVIARAVHHRRWCHGGGGGHFGHHHHHRHWHRGGWGGGPGPMWGSFDGDDHGDPGASFRHGPDAPPWMQGGRAQRFFVGKILQHVQATPAQETAIGKAFGEFRDEMKKLGAGEARRTKSEIANALRQPTFDGVALGEQFARHDTVLESGRKAFVGLMARVHDALEPEQRDRLAGLLGRGPRFGWWR